MQSVLDGSLGVTGSCVTRIVDEKQLSEEVRSRYQVGWARPARTSPLFSYRPGTNKTYNRKAKLPMYLE